MPSLHRVRFTGGAVVLFQLRDLVLPVVVTSQLLAAIAKPIALRDPANGDRWRYLGLRGRRGVAVTPVLTVGGSTSADAAPLASPDLPDDLLERFTA